MFATRFGFALLVLCCLPRPASGQVELKNLEFRKRHDLTWDVSWRVDVLNRGTETVRVRLRFQLIDAEGFAVADDNGQLTVPPGDSLTYREVRPFTPATYDAIKTMQVTGETVP